MDSTATATTINVAPTTTTLAKDSSNISTAGTTPETAKDLSLEFVAVGQLQQQQQVSNNSIISSGSDSSRGSELLIYDDEHHLGNVSVMSAPSNIIADSDNSSSSSSSRRRISLKRDTSSRRRIHFNNNNNNSDSIDMPDHNQNGDDHTNDINAVVDLSGSEPKMTMAEQYVTAGTTQSTTNAYRLLVSSSPASPASEEEDIHNSRMNSNYSSDSKDFVSSTGSLDDILLDDDEPESSSSQYVIAINDLSIYDNTGSSSTSLAETMRSQLKYCMEQNNVVMITRTWCPFTKTVLSLLVDQLKVTVHIIYADTIPNGSTILSCARQEYKHKTIPMIFIKNKFIGGCDQLYAMHETGRLEQREYLFGLMNASRTMNATCVETAALAPLQRTKLLSTTTAVTKNMTKSTAKTTKKTIDSTNDACNPYFWFPNTVNNHVVRIVAVEVCIGCILSACFYNTEMGRGIALFLLIDCIIRTVSGSSLSPLGMVGMLFVANVKPNFRPGPQTQLSAFIAMVFALLSTLSYYYVSNVLGAVIIVMLGGATGLKGFLDICLACIFFEYGIRFGVVSSSLCKIYTVTREELNRTWDYTFNDHSMSTKKIQPVRVDHTNDTNDGDIGLQYKKKSDEWRKDDFDYIRHVESSYFGIPTSIATLAVAYKIASSKYPIQTILSFDNNSDIANDISNNNTERIIFDVVYYYVFASLSAVLFIGISILYICRLKWYPRKIKKEWDHPIKSSGFAYIPICIMFYAILICSRATTATTSDDEVIPTRIIARILFWIACTIHTLLTISKVGEWIGRRLELEHINAYYMLYPIGMIVCSFTAIYIDAFDVNKHNTNTSSAIGGDYYNNANGLLARFFYSFGYLLILSLFVITFFKVMTQHNTCLSERHGYWLWVASASIVGIANYSICITDVSASIWNNYNSVIVSTTTTPTINDFIIQKANNDDTCTNEYSNYFFVSILLFYSLFWSTLPSYNFMGQDVYSGANYWYDVFAITLLGCCSTLFYSISYNKYTTIGYILQAKFLCISCIANFVALIYFYIGIIRRRKVFTPDTNKVLMPLSYMKLTHDAIRAYIPKLISSLSRIDVLNDPYDTNEYIAIFAVNLNHFITVHTEHSKHENDIVFKLFNDLFAKHASKYIDDHAEDDDIMKNWIALTNILLKHKKHNNTSGNDGNKEAIDYRYNTYLQLRESMVQFFQQHYESHLRGEEDNLNPIGKKYISISHGRDITKEVWKSTAVSKWEIIIPFIIVHLPRHNQRIQYIRTLIMCLPNHMQQIGAIIYRHVDAVMWERIRYEIPEIIPRGAPNWRRYY